MNYRIVLYILGQLLKVEAAILVLPLIVAVAYGEATAVIFLAVIALLVLLSIALTVKKPQDRRFYAREGYVTVVLCWVLFSLIGALPFTLSGEIPNYIDAVFEMVSGFSTTGATILKDIEAMSRGMMFWRCFSHWIGGMGILVFLISLAPLVGASSIHMLRAESPGLTVDKLVPKIRSSAVILYAIYAGMTLLEVVLLLFGGMDLYDALVHSFSTAGTGGFSNYADSVAHFGSVYIEMVIAAFMFLFGVCFQLYFFITVGKLGRAVKNEELRWYVIIVAASVLVIAANTLPLYADFGQGLRYGFFQVTSVISTTGMATANFDLWPSLSKAVLCLLMVVGACAGSTGGGVKVVRIVVVFKAIWRELKRLVRPRHVAVVKLNSRALPEEVVHNAVVFVAAYGLLLAVSFLLVSLDGFDMTTTFTSVLSCTGNVGPGLSLVGPMGNYSIFSPLSKIVLSIDMIAGRLEIFPILMLFSRDVWKRD